MKKHDKNFKSSFFKEQAQKMLFVGRYFSSVGLIVLFYFIYQDIGVFKYSSLIFFRTIGLLSLIVLFVFCMIYKKSSYKAVNLVFLFCFCGLVVMMCCIVGFLFFKHAPLEEKIGAIHGLFFVNLCVLIFSLGVSHFLIFSYFPVFLLPVFLILSKVPLKEIVLLSNCVGFSIACIVLGILFYKLQYREFFIKWLLHVKNVELNQTVQKLSITVAHLEKEISKRKILEKRLKELSMMDDLTHIYNRRAGMAILETEIKEAEKFKRVFSVCFLDFDNFKHINDIFGHKEGDLVLKEFVNIVKKVIREKEDMLFRFGGDEFLLLLKDTDEFRAKEVVKRIKEHIESSLKLQKYSFDFSVGIVEFKKGMSVEDLIKEADNRMYRDKKEKKAKQTLSLRGRDKVDV